MSIENRSRGVWDGKPSRLVRFSAAALALGFALQYQPEHSYSAESEDSQAITLQVDMPYRLEVSGLAKDGIVIMEPPVVAESAPEEPEQQVLPEEVEGERSTKYITGYYCEYDSGFYGDGGNFCGAMANGEIVHEGAAACGPSYDFGTVFEIEGYGEVVCKDTGSAIHDGRIDVFTYYSSGLSSIPQGYREVVER